MTIADYVREVRINEANLLDEVKSPAAALDELVVAIDNDQRARRAAEVDEYLPRGHTLGARRRLDLAMGAARESLAAEERIARNRRAN